MRDCWITWSDKNHTNTIFKINYFSLITDCWVFWILSLLKIIVIYYLREAFHLDDFLSFIQLSLWADSHGERYFHEWWMIEFPNGILTFSCPISDFLSYPYANFKGGVCLSKIYAFRYLYRECILHHENFPRRKILKKELTTKKIMKIYHILLYYKNM